MRPAELLRAVTAALTSPDEETAFARLPGTLERLDAVREPAQPGAARGRGTADAVVAHLDPRVPVLALHADADHRRAGVLGHVRQRLRDDVVRGGLDRPRQPLVQRHRQLDGHRRPVGDGTHRRLEAALGQHRGVDAARELPQLLQGEAQLLAGLHQLFVLRVPAARAQPP